MCASFNLSMTKGGRYKIIGRIPSKLMFYRNKIKYRLCT
jgi:hypothetical protein